ncbi:MAG: glycosyltransferase, partial [Spirochaetes bacterium]|nr:glycosyltransferase [Spirochaetota bacterium]
KMKLPNISKGIENCGRIFLEIICLSNTGEFFGGFIGTDQKKNREVSLGIITCTYKKDAFIKKTVDTILDDNDLLKKNIEIFVIDNGNTLRQNDFEDSRIKLIVNKNFGGSGGFNRGLIEAYSNDKITHFLLMDDDIELDSESIFRLFSLFEYAVMDIVVSGNMLDLLKKDILYESGAVYGIRPNNWKDPFAIAPLKYNLSLSQNDSLNLLLNEEHIDYGGFWFFALTRKIVATTGLLMPFFIKVDDMEFGLRINKYFSDIIIAFPSIGVWHEPFYAKRPMWDYYYYIRNFLITNSIYNIFSYFKTICAAILNIFQNILYAEIFLRAFLDFMKGPKNIKNINSETTHREIIILSGKYIKIRNKKKLIRIIYKLFNLLFIFQWLIVAIYSFPKWKSTRQQWKEASRELTSFNFWNSYLGIDKSSHKKT